MKASLSRVFCASAAEDAITRGRGPSSRTRSERTAMRCRMVSVSATSRSKGKLSVSGKCSTESSTLPHTISCSYSRRASSGPGAMTRIGTSNPALRADSVKGTACCRTCARDPARSELRLPSSRIYSGVDSNSGASALRLIGLLRSLVRGPQWPDRLLPVLKGARPTKNAERASPHDAG